MTIYFAALLGLTALVAFGIALEPLLGSPAGAPPTLGPEGLKELNRPQRPGPLQPRRRARVNRGQLLGLAGSLAFVGFAVLLAAAALRTDAPVRADPVARLESSPTADLFVTADGQSLAFGTVDGTWLTSPLAPDPRLSQIDSQPIAAGATAGILAADGSRWIDSQRESLPLPEAITVIGSSRSGIRIVAADAAGRLFLSDDGGSSWREGRAGSPDGLQALSLSDSDPRIWAATSIQGVLVGDGDSGWGGANGFVNGALPTARIFDIDYDPDSGDSTAGAAGSVFVGALYAATDQGLYRSLDGGAAWAPLPGGIAARAVFGDGRHHGIVWAVDVSGNLYRSGDGGRNWA